MRISRVKADNWRNFKALEFPVRTRIFVVGPNASGKSNLLDLFRFLCDISRSGGGLASALDRRGGLSKARSLFARNHRNGRLIVEIHLEDGADTWVYRLAIKGEAGGLNRPIVDEERVERGGEVILVRPNEEDAADPERLTQTHLEQISANRTFRPLAEYFAKVTYFHPVPQVIREPGRSVKGVGDPFGGDIIERMNATPSRTRHAWFRRMQTALQAAVPEFESLGVVVDAGGRPHLVAGYRNWREHPAQHTEVEFSDGTLRLIGLLWTIVSAPANGGVLLLEEPELSLNSAIVRMLPTVLAQAQRDRSLQVLLSTHAPELLDDEGVLPDEVLVLRPTSDGTTASLLADIEEVAAHIEAELPTSDVVEGLIAPKDLRGLMAIGSNRA